jgi:NAD(P)-dependent dehydrogenase (short-subunit alcohol dehydrogenase family)
MTSDLIGQGLTGKVAVVTGGSSGIGQFTALGLAQQGASVVITGRDPARLTRTALWLRAQAPAADIAAEQVDFTALASVRALASRLLDRYPRIDILVDNAGMVTPRRAVTGDGFEAVFQANHLAPFLLTNLLLPPVRAAGGRIVIVASTAHKSARIDFADLQLAQRWGVMKAYGRSKLMNIMFAYALARRLEGGRATVNCLHPGFVATRIGAKGGVFDLIWAVLKPFALSPAKGAETSIYAASAPEMDGVSGRYLFEKRPIRSSDVSYDIEAGERLWRISAEMTGIPA